MNPTALNGLLRRFRRQLAATHVLQIGLVVALVVGMLWATRLPRPESKRLIFFLAAAGTVVWILFIINAVQLTRRVQTGSVLLSMRRYSDAEVWFCRAMERFSFSTRPKFIACQQLASLLFERDAHPEAVAICREVLRHRLTGLRNVWINARLLLADSLLLLDEVAEAYEVMQPVHNVSLSLSNRMKLLPIQLRYELAADSADCCVRELREKVRLAELLGASGAALVHALLAEACRRQGMTAQYAFLVERARLYHDLDPLVDRYPVIAPAVAPDTDSELGPAPGLSNPPD